MIKEPTKEEYIALILQLIYFKDASRKFMPECDLKVLDKAIETLRYYYQFKK